MSAMKARFITKEGRDDYHSTLHTSHQLALGKRRSQEMQATHCITPYELMAFQEFSWLHVYTNIAIPIFPLQNNFE